MNGENTDVRKVIPAVNIIEDDYKIILEAEMSGLGKNDVGIDVNGDTLVIKGRTKDRAVPEGYNLIYGERCKYEYERSFALGNDVNKEKIQAKCDNGILKITLTKSEESQPRKITIQ